MKWHGFGTADLPKRQIQIVEIDKGTRVPPIDEGVAQSIKTLQSHPGFQYLLAKLKFHREVLKNQLSGSKQASMEDVMLLQSGIAWSGWLQNELDRAIDFKTSAPQAPSATELSIFEESQRQIEVLR